MQISQQLGVTLGMGGNALPFEDSLLLGNGRMGAAVHGSADAICIPLNRSDIWDYRHDGLPAPDFSYKKVGELIRCGNWREVARLKEALMNSYLKPYPGYAPAGSLMIRRREPGTAADGVLHLQEAVAEVKWSDGSTLEGFVAANTDVLVVRLKAGREAGCSLRLWRSPWRDYSPPAASAEGHHGEFLFTFPDGFRYAIALVAPGWRIETDGSEVWATATENALGEPLDLYLSIATSRDAEDPLVSARETAFQAYKSGWDALLAQHRTWWRDFWASSSLRLSDPDLELAWYAQLYQLASSSRPGCLPPNLQGIWNIRNHPDWHADYHYDLNVQMTAWPVFTANHPELALPFAEFAANVLPVVREETKRHWELPGAKFPCACDPLGHDLFGYITASYWAGSAAWAAEPSIWYHRHTRDQAFARNVALPLLEAGLGFYRSFLQLGEDGRYHVPLTTSPESWENGDEAWGCDATLDLAVLRQLARATLQIYDDLKIAGAFRDFCSDLLVRLAEYPVIDGAWSELEGKVYPEPHRHLSVLAPIYPTAEVDLSPGSPGRRLAEASYEAFVGRGPITNWGCTYAWLSLVASRLGRADDAERWMMLARSTLSKTLMHTLKLDREDWSSGDGQHLSEVDALLIQQGRQDSERSDEGGRRLYEIDGGAGFFAAINEMLLSSLRGRIRLFPATPNHWRCSFTDFRAEGAFLVSSSFESGRIGLTKIKSLIGGVCFVERTPCWNQVKISVQGKDLSFASTEYGVAFETLPGQEYLLQFS